MIARTRFFVASLWAALAPVGMLVVGAVWVVLFPDVHGLGEMVHRAGGLALIGVPFAYTAVVVATYGIARALYELRVLARLTLVLAYSVLSVMAASFMTWWLAAGSVLDIVRSFALFLTLSLIASGSAVFVWWRVASRGVPEPGAPLEDPAEPRMRVRRRRHRSFLKRLASRL